VQPVVDESGQRTDIDLASGAAHRHGLGRDARLVLRVLGATESRAHSTRDRHAVILERERGCDLRDLLRCVVWSLSEQRTELLAEAASRARRRDDWKT